MSVYNQNIQTRIVDPVFDRKNFKTEFRLDADTVYLSNWRLIDMGLTSNVQSAYNPLIGAFCMKSIQLLDGNKLLDQILEADLWKAYNAFNASNDEARSINNWVDKSNYAFTHVAIETNSLDYQDWNVGGTELPDVNGIKVLSTTLDQFNSDTTAANSDRAWFAVKGFLPFLASSLYLPTGIYKNLRLVINWKSPAELQANAPQPANTYNTIENTALVVDEIMDDRTKMLVMKNYKGVVYRAVEHDSVQVNTLAPAAGSTQVQKNRFLINGFNNKSVERLVAIQTPQNRASYDNGGVNDGVGRVGSFAQLNSEFQFRVNGQNKLPRDGFTKKNQRLAALVDAYGEAHLPPSCNFVYVPLMTDKLLPIASDSFVQGMQGQLDWTAVEIREPVKELIVEYNRTGVHGNVALNQALRLNLFAECTKAVSVQPDGRYIISYL
tara:strand:+ start:3214 stop:4527 length:1314 start_codon:yes stop_codon:yes gene_type:complete